MPKKQSSTNPFDSSHSSEDDDGIVYDNGAAPKRDRRSAPLDFSVKQSGEAPKLKFHNSPKDAGGGSAFQSPLENALVQEFAGPSRTPVHPPPQRYDSEMNSSLESEEDDIVISEESPLLATQATPYDDHEEHNRNKKNREWIPIQNNTVIRRNASKSSLALSIDTGARSRRSSPPKSRVLKELTTTRQEDEYKMIRLEDVGTAKSWMILLLPYFAFGVCVLLESNTSLKVAELGPLSARLRCFSDRKSKEYTVPIVPAPPDPCTYQFDLSDQELSPLMIEAQVPHQKKNFTARTQRTNNAWGAAFESGIITSVPPAATFLAADSSFYHLSLRSMAAIENGSVLVTGLLFQKRGSSSDGNGDWSVVATSRTEPLSMACYFELVAEESERQWVCHSPGIMTILFSMPGSAILSGDELRVSILFSYTQAQKNSSSTTYLYADDQLHKMLHSVQIKTEEEEEDVVSDIVGSSEFTIRHTNSTALTIDVWGRLIALAATVVFGVFWFRSLGFQGCCSFSCFCCGKDRDDFYEIRRGTLKAALD